jgi:hypothetical protein
LREPRADLERARELLRPGGLLVISTPNLDGWYPRATYPLRSLLKMWRPVEPPFHLTQFSARTLTGLLEATGWEIVRLRQYAQPLMYSFGGPREMRSPKRLLYALVFLPIAWLGPKFGAGDEMAVIARRT